MSEDLHDADDPTEAEPLRGAGEPRDAAGPRSGAGHRPAPRRGAGPPPRPVPRLTVLLLVLLACVAALSGGAYLWLRARSGGASAGGPTPQQLAERAAIQGRPFPRGVRYPTLQPFQAAWGKELRLDRWLGHEPMVVNVWASWCVPCKKEVPLLERAWATHRHEVQFVGIDFRDRAADAASFVRRHGMTYPSGSDPRGSGRALHVLGLPTTFFVDRAGRVVDERIGELTAAELARGVGEISRRPSPASGP